MTEKMLAMVFGTWSVSINTLIVRLFVRTEKFYCVIY